MKKTMIWGIDKPLEELTEDEIVDQVDARLFWISRIQKDLPYADHGAYGQDLERMGKYREEIATLRRFLQT